MRSLPIFVITTAAVALSGAASAQTREGFFIGVNTGVAWGQAQGTGLAGTNDGTWTLPIRLGWKLNDRMLLGAETGVWEESGQDGGVTVASYTLALYYYPTVKGPFLKGGLGLSHASLDLVDSQGASGTGVSLMLGAGYDIPIGTKVAVTPLATFRYGGPDTLNLRSGGQPMHGFRYSVIDIGIGFSFY